MENSRINPAMMLASILEKYNNHKYMSKFQMPLVVVFAKLNINKLKINNEICFLLQMAFNLLGINNKS